MTTQSNIQTAEHVSYHHVANCFIRGKWNREDVCKSTMLMSKCCHDLDLITWLMSGIEPVRVSSFGSRSYFRREKAPANSGEYCLLDCPIEAECQYSNRQLNLNHPERWAAYVWPQIEHLENPTREIYEQELKRKSDSNRILQIPETSDCPAKAHQIQPQMKIITRDAYGVSDRLERIA